MDLERGSIRMSAAVLVFALLLRFFAGGGAAQLVQAATSPEVAAAILFLETGRMVRFPEETKKPATAVDSPVQTGKEQQEEEKVQAVFSASDASLVKVNSSCSYKANIKKALSEPLKWELTGKEPKVLIIHTHASESYEKTENYTESSAYRTLNKNYNMVSIGAYVAKLLKKEGISVLHDKTIYDYPSYNGSYIAAREGIEKHLKENPSICFVLDIHRDAMQNSDGTQIGTTVKTKNGTASQLMLVVGTDDGGMSHPNWQDNLSLAVKLHAQLEQLQPGICRPISLRGQRFNQDLTPGGALVEVGAAGNTRKQALLAAEILVEAITALAHGAK